MAVAGTHPEHDITTPKWQRVRVFLAGEELVKPTHLEGGGVSKNHRIKPNEKSQRGFSGVRFRDQTLLRGEEACGRAD